MKHKSSVTMSDLQAQTKKLSGSFDRKFGKVERALDLVEEVGELAQAILISEKIKLTRDPNKQRTKTDVADALSDILYDLFMLSEDYQLDLSLEYSKMLEALKSRIDSGEFNAYQ